MDNYIHFLDRAAPLEELGGKGTNLVLLAQGGFPVPAGFCVTAGAYRDFVQGIGLEESIQRLASRADVAHPQLLEERAGEIQRLLLAHPLPSPLKHAIAEAYDRLAEQTGKRDLAVAVRSSATTEDLAQASFAGQHDSFLNIVGPTAVGEHVQRCWASLWSHRAMDYRQRHGFDHRHAAMAVVVQELVPAQVSGVLFTANPVNGETAQVVMNASWGLGEAIASGLVNPDSFTLAKQPLSILERSRGEKETMLKPGPQGGAHQVPVPERKRQRLCLTDGQVLRLGKLALAVEKRLGIPQDMEWALQGRRFFLLQSRPMTALPAQPPSSRAWEVEEDDQGLWTLDPEMYPSPLAPMEAHVRGVWYQARQHALLEIGAATLPEHRIVNGHLYTREVPNELSEEEGTERQRAFEAKVAAYLDRVQTIWDSQHLPQIQANLARLRAFDLERASLPELWDHLQESLKVFERHWEIHWMMGGQTSRTRWPAVFSDLTGISDRRAAGQLLMAIPNKTTETITGLRTLAKLVQASAPLSQAFASHSPEELLSVLEGNVEGAAFLHWLEEFLEAYGYRSGGGYGAHVSVITPTWREDPVLVLRLLQQYLEQDLEAMEQRDLWAVQERDRALLGALERVGTDPERQRRFQQELALAQKGATLMENHNFYIEQATMAWLRYAFLALGERLAATGLMEARDDIFYLTPEELERASLGPSSPDLLFAVQERKEQHVAWAYLTPPPTLGRGTAPAQTPSNDAEEAGVLRGRGVSAGRATGRARLVTTLELVPQVRPGDILVSQNAGPLWTPIIPLLRGMVLDSGAAGQHAALIAREYGVPAVIQARSATQVIREGQTITIDGSSGLVLIHELSAAP